jgi:DNA-directed RNA polymerase subunit E'/Rpb7
MAYKLLSPYKNTIQYATIQVLPQHMNSDILSNMELILKHKVENKCNKHGYIDKVHTIDKYYEGNLITENFLGAANYKVDYQCRMCLPIENTMIIAKVHNINSELVILSNGPIIIFVPKENIDTNIWNITNNITHKKNDKILKIDDYIKVVIDKIRINQNDTQIKSIGILNDFAKTSEKEMYFGSIINEDEEENNNFIL